MTTTTRTTTPAAPEPAPALEAPHQGIGGAHGRLIEIARQGVFEPTPGMVGWTRLANLAYESAFAVAASGVQGVAVEDAENGWRQATARRLATELAVAGAGRVLTAADLDAAADELGRLEDRRRGDRLRALLADELIVKLRELAANAFHESAVLPAVQAAQADVLRRVAALPLGVPRTGDDAAAADDEGRAAYLELKRLADAYDAVRSAWELARQGTTCSDQRALFADTPVPPVTNPAPTISDTAHRRAGPEGRLERLVWLSGGGQGHCPSAAQQSALYEAWHAGGGPRQGPGMAGDVPDFPFNTPGSGWTPR